MTSVIVLGKAPRLPRGSGCQPQGDVDGPLFRTYGALDPLLVKLGSIANGRGWNWKHTSGFTRKRTECKRARLRNFE